MQPEAIFLLSVAAAVVVVVLAIRKKRRQAQNVRNAIDMAVGEASWPDWW